MSKIDQIEFEQKIPIKYTSDIVVVGGGMAGVGAACIAAKYGCSVILVEHFAILGGNATVGGVNGFCGETLGSGQIFDEILMDLERFNSIEPYSEKKDFAFRFRKFNEMILPYILQELVLKYHVHLLLHAQAVAVKKDAQGKISELIIAGRSNLEAIRAKIVIDCSGDGIMGTIAGCETMKGDAPNFPQLPMSYVGYVKNTPVFYPPLKIPHNYFSGKKYLQKSDLPMVSLIHCNTGVINMKIKVPNFDATDTQSMTDAEIEGRRKFMRLFEYYRHYDHSRWTVAHNSPIMGIREGQRIKGLYILTTENLRAGKNFFDAVAVGTYSLDAHDPRDDKRSWILKNEQMNIPPYHIPLRSLIAKDCPNLMMAGRNLSADYFALSSARIMPTCMQMGESTGSVAALCIQNMQLPQYYCEIEQNFAPVAARLKEINLNLDLNWYIEKKKKSTFVGKNA